MRSSTLAPSTSFVEYAKPPSGVEIGALTTLTEIAERPAEATFFSARRSGVCGRKPADPQHWYPRRQRLAGCALLVLSPRFVVLPSWGQPLLRRHAAGHEPRAFSVRDEPLRAAGAQDTAPALVALDATMVLRSADGERTLSAEEYFVGPAVDIENTTALRSGEILTAVRLPKAWANASFYYEKVADHVYGTSRL